MCIRDSFGTILLHTENIFWPQEISFYHGWFWEHNRLYTFSDTLRNVNNSIKQVNIYKTTQNKRPASGNLELSMSSCTKIN